MIHLAREIKKKVEFGSQNFEHRLRPSTFDESRWWINSRRCSMTNSRIILYLEHRERVKSFVQLIWRCIIVEKERVKKNIHKLIAHKRANNVIQRNVTLLVSQSFLSNKSSTNFNFKPALVYLLHIVGVYRRARVQHFTRVKFCKIVRLIISGEENLTEYFSFQ